jgi:hypothetical protein
MIKVASVWEHGWMYPLMEVDLWRMMLRSFNIDYFYMTPISGIRKYKNFKEVSSMEEILDKNKNLNKVFVSEKGDINLKEFDHPKNTLYIFNRSGGADTLRFKTNNDVSVFIETPNSKEIGLLWGHQACSIVLYDRFLKGV